MLRPGWVLHDLVAHCAWAFVALLLWGLIGLVRWLYGLVTF